MGHSCEIPKYSQKILNGDITLEDFKKQKGLKGDLDFRKGAGEDLIKRDYNLIKECDCILVLNLDKKGVKNYIGGNTFLEIGFAHVLDKKIFLLNPIPEMGYTDEVKAVEPVVLNGDLAGIR